MISEITMGQKDMPLLKLRSSILALFVVSLVGGLSCAQDSEKPLAPDEGIPVVSWQEADKALGRVGIVYGNIVRVGNTQKIHFLNFSSDRSAFTAVIFSPNDEKFPDDIRSMYEGKLVKIRGTITQYRGNPQIVVTKPEQITIVDSLPETYLPQQKLIVLGDELIIGSYNIKNLFDDEDDPYHNDETTPAKPRDELVRVAAVIREFNPDVLALQEVENRGYLERFIATLLPDMGYRYVVHYEGNDHRGIDVCLISRVPIGAVTSYRHLVFQGASGDQSFNRDLLCVEIRPENGDAFEMWVIHLKSNSGGKEAALPIRLAECRQLHAILAERLEREPDAPFILCGDFNDTFDSQTLSTILGSPRLLKTIFDGVPEDGRITYNREPYLSMIDFMLCSPSMAERYVEGSFAIRLGSDQDSGSDHNPIYARFRKTAGEDGTSASRDITSGEQEKQAASRPVEQKVGRTSDVVPALAEIPVDSDSSKSVESDESELGTSDTDAEKEGSHADSASDRWRLVGIGGTLAIAVIALAIFFRK